MTFRLPTWEGDFRVRHIRGAEASNRSQDPVRSGPVQRRIGGEV